LGEAKVIARYGHGPPTAPDPVGLPDSPQARLRCAQRRGLFHAGQAGRAGRGQRLPGQRAGGRRTTASAPLVFHTTGGRSAGDFGNGPSPP